MEILVDKVAHLLVYELKMRMIFDTFAKTAKEEGYLLVSNVFKEISNLNQQYSRWILNLYRDLNKKPTQNTKVIIDFGIFNSIGTTLENLILSIKQLEYEWKILYSEIEFESKEKKLRQLSLKLDSIIEIKKKNYYRLKTILNFLEKNILIKGNDLIVWICRACNFEISIDNLPDEYICPSCGHLKSYFEKENLNSIYLNNSELNIWKCIECGEEITLDILPNNWKCGKCGKSKEYFQKISKSSRASELLDIETTKVIWECMECGEEAKLESLPNNWKCPKCGKSKEYFKRKSVISKKKRVKKKKAIWICEKCGNNVEIDISSNLKCPFCGD